MYWFSLDYVWIPLFYSLKAQRVDVLGSFVMQGMGWKINAHDITTLLTKPLFGLPYRNSIKHNRVILWVWNVDVFCIPNRRATFFIGLIALVCNIFASNGSLFMTPDFNVLEKMALVDILSILYRKSTSFAKMQFRWKQSQKAETFLHKVKSFWHLRHLFHLIFFWINVDTGYL